MQLVDIHDKWEDLLKERKAGFFIGGEEETDNILGIGVSEFVDIVFLQDSSHIYECILESIGYDLCLAMNERFYQCIAFHTVNSNWSKCK